MENQTLNYYERNAASFVSGTVSVDFRETQERFFRRLQPEDFILDFGCGSGRDTKCFLELGYRVEATDGSEELCKMASKYTGIEVKKMLFQELEEHEKYDGIWACSSILHLPKDELKVVFGKMKDALKEHGIIYTSFKYGDFEGMRNGRFFSDFTIESFRNFMNNICGLQIDEFWITGDVRRGRGEEKWLNLILQKI
ncbi:MAG: class I SAM-dependent methyltransferase [Lachnospiraceae bacterium]|nr:class I SAM-dependent methyltransferase [Lachnospiraceae bacterium]